MMHYVNTKFRGAVKINVFDYLFISRNIFHTGQSAIYHKALASLIRLGRAFKADVHNYVN